jgi:tRNA(His) 5'-end guanylyltransferase
MLKTDAVLGYTQSDEISLAFTNASWFGGKVQKLSSVLSGLASFAFMSYIIGTEYEDRAMNMLPHFDARVFDVPDKTELTNAILWRVHDAKKNSISMAARAEFSHRKLQGKSGIEMIKMLSDNGIDYQGYPDHFKYGTFLVKETEEQYISDETWNLIPDHEKPDDRMFMRSVINNFSSDMTFNDISKIIG